MLKYNSVYNHLADDLSKIYFEARKLYQENPNPADFYSVIRNAHLPYQFREFSNRNFNGFVLLGEKENWLRYHTLLLQDSGYNVVVSFVFSEKCLELITQCGYGIIVQNQDRSMVPAQIPADNIICLDSHLVGRCGWQYFDYFKPYPDECFLDGGALDGSTTMEFLKWSKNQYGCVYAFEPNPLQRDLCRNNLQRICNPSIHFYDYAIWDREEILSFEAHPYSKWDAHISEHGQYTVHAATIDKLLKGKKVSFIKLDVEGSELRALKGARQIILRNRPRMAVSIYHNPDDFIQIPLYLLSLCPDYNFSIRHYHSDPIETILYVF